MHAITTRLWPGRLRLTGSSALALTTVGTNLVRIVSTVCLTRLLAPEVYGVVGMIMSIFFMVNMLTDIGLQAYVIRHPRSDEPGFLDSVFTIHAVRGVGLAAISMLLAWPLSLILAKPELFAPLAVSSLLFVIDGQVSLHQFKALRDGKVPRFTLVDFGTNLTQTVTAIIFAFFFRNVWAIVASMLIGSLVRTWSTYALFPGGRHRFRYDRTVSTDLWRFSRVVAASSALTLVIGQVDKLALGRILPLSQFGFYVLATSLAAAPTVFAYNYATAIVYPAVATASREGRSVADAYYGCWRRFFYLYAFGAGGLIGVADLLVRLLYDPRYVSVAHYLSILAVSTALAMVNRGMENVQVAMGRPRIGVELNLVRLIWLTGGGALAIARADPLTFVLTIGLVEVPAYLFGLWRLAGNHIIRWQRELSLILTILAGVVVGGAGSYVGRLLFPSL
jgi:O-antigen/teichoic acid export membrane protein